ncbi:MAG: hypothetical protein WBQ25_24880 [Nitrososphaeraceae archaeon]
MGYTEAQHIITDKVESISKEVYNEIQYGNLFAISSEPRNIKEYINEVLREVWKIDPGLLRKEKDKLPSEDDK